MRTYQRDNYGADFFVPQEQYMTPNDELQEDYYDAITSPPPAAPVPEGAERQKRATAFAISF